MTLGFVRFRPNLGIDYPWYLHNRGGPCPLRQAAAQQYLITQTSYGWLLAVSCDLAVRSESVRVRDDPHVKAQKLEQ